MITSFVSRMLMKKIRKQLFFFSRDCASNSTEGLRNSWQTWFVDRSVMRTKDILSEKPLRGACLQRKQDCIIQLEEKRSIQGMSPFTLFLLHYCTIFVNKCCSDASNVL